jgi:hypothetical protein
VLKAIEKDDATRKASKAKANKAEQAKRAAEAQQAKSEQIESTEEPSNGPLTSKPKTSSLGSFF